MSKFFPYDPENERILQERVAEWRASQVAQLKPPRGWFDWLFESPEEQARLAEWAAIAENRRRYRDDRRAKPKSDALEIFGCVLVVVFFLALAFYTIATRGPIPVIIVH
jgi:hypothetical protein